MSQVNWKDAIVVGFFVLYALACWGGLTIRKRYHRHNPENRRVE